MKLRDSQSFIRLLVLLLAFSAAPLIHANNEAADENEVDYLELASLMMRDGNLDRAEVALAQVELEADGVDVQRFHVISGMLAGRLNRHEAARDSLLKAIELGEVEPVIHVHLAQTAYTLEDYRLALESLDRAGEAVARIPSGYHMRAQSHWFLTDYTAAIAVLDQASSVFEDDASFDRRKLFYFVELGLYSDAAEIGKVYLAENDASAEDFIAIGNALRASGQYQFALEFLQEARIRYPQNEQVAKALALVYINTGHYHSAAAIVHEAALLNPVLLSEAAELYRRAGQHYMALSLNSQVSDQQDKLKQRLALLLETGDYDQAASMEVSLKRNRLDQLDDIRYALAYAYFKTGQFSQSEQYLAGISDTVLFKKSLELRKAIEDCTVDSWRCQ